MVKKNKDVIRKCYRIFLKREPDEQGFNHYLYLLEKNEIDEEKLIEIIKNSDEYKRKKRAEIFDIKSPFIYKGLYNISYVIYPNSIMDYLLTQNGISDSIFIKLVKSVVPSNGIIFDIGAHSGLMSLPFSVHNVPDGFVYAFEPHPEIMKKLEKNVNLNNLDNVKTESLALQDNPSIKKIILHIREAIHDDGRRNQGLSTIQENFSYYVKDEEVEASTLDQYVMDQSISSIDLIKIDVEGAESKVLLGSRRLIDRCLPIIIYEYSLDTDKLTNFPNTVNCFKFLHDNGYKQYRILNDQNLKEIKVHDPSLPDSDMICFHHSKIPHWI